MSTSGPSTPPELSTESLRVRLDPSCHYGRLQCLWLLGRALNELSYLLQRAWLITRIDTQRVDQLWSDSHILLDELGVAEEVSQELNSSRSAWDVAFLSEQHIGSLHDANQMLVGSYEHGLPLPIGDDELSIYEGQVAMVAKLFAPLVDGLRNTLNTQEQRVFALAVHADQSIHPHLTRRTVDFLEEPGESHGEGWDAVRVRWPRWFPVACVELKPSWPDEGWFRALQFQSSQLFTSPPELLLPTGRECLTAIFDDLFAAIGSLQSPAESAVASTHTTLQQAAERWQLTVNQTMSTVQRQGYHHTVHLQPRLFRLFQHLLVQNEEPTTREWFCNHWRRFGNRETCRPNTVCAAISELNSDLARIGLLVQSVETGWILTEKRIQSPPSDY